MEKLRVKDLMVPLDQYVCVSDDATVTDAVMALEEAQGTFVSRSYPHRAVLVCDKDGKVIGKVGHLDVLRSLEPRYSEIGDLKKVSGFGLSAEFMRSMMEKHDLWKSPLEDLCRKAARVRLGSIVAAPLEGELIEQGQTLDQAVHQLIMGNHQSLLVTFEGRIVGVLRLSDVYAEVGSRIKACKI